MTEVGQAVMATRLLLPDTARARPASLLGTNLGWTRVFPPSESEELYLKALVVIDAVDDYLRTAGAKAIADDATNARFYLASGYVLEASKVRKVEDFEKVPTASLKDNPTSSTLAALHALLDAEVKKIDDGKTAVDRIFKGANLKVAFFREILSGS